ncbi:NAD(P)-binding protein [Nadsonia fulvescens var. elongata DSM 6958]|uniref:NAD(P)-binding protein n=1 Tax=Nadsonia fulvescens var. elongata DSM 6958 TaxID=857566 RepID=A0A1E3PR94_9ASCO|nr:NAD(P)-binding protein [Nadsonia fulvescens var. elongata DSM 6958]
MRSYSLLNQLALPLLKKTVLITGGSKGIGHSIGQKLATQGANIILLSRNQAALDTALASLPILDSHQTHGTVSLDVGTINRPWTEQDLGIPLKSVDILVNSAGVSQNSLLMATEPEKINSLISTNLTGTIFACQTFVKPMLRKKGGVIINISSVLALRGQRGSSIYSATKAGIIGFTKSLANELGHKNIRVNAICPGLVDTEMSRAMSDKARQGVIAASPLNRLVTPEEIADVAVMLALNQAINGSVITVDGGYSS